MKRIYESSLLSSMTHDSFVVEGVSPHLSGKVKARFSFRSPHISVDLNVERNFDCPVQIVCNVHISVIKLNELFTF